MTGLAQWQSPGSSPTPPVRLRHPVIKPTGPSSPTRRGATRRKPPEKTGSGVSAEHQYLTMTTEQIAALPVGIQAAPDAELYLWVTNSVLIGSRPSIRGYLEPVDIIRQWGFEPKTILTWHKLGILGLGFYFRGDTEHVIYATRGTIQIPPALRVSNHFAASRTGHSAKPDRFYEIVERVSPGPYLELFARRRRYGWDVWGNEAPKFAASQAEMGLGA